MGRKLQGIYQIRNLVNGKIYIGSSTDILGRRFKTHRNSLNRGAHRNPHLQNSWDKYGEENFEFDVIEEISDKHILLRIEQWYLDNWNPDYNIAKIAGSPMSGRHHSKEAKEKIASSLSGENSYWYGKSLSDEHREKLSKSASKRKASSETRAKMSNSKKGEKNNFYGKTHSESSLKKLSGANAGERSAKAKVTNGDVLEIRRLYSTGDYSQMELGDMFGIGNRTVGQIVNRETWKHI